MRRKPYLPTILRLAVEHALRRKVKVRVIRDHDGRLAAELERHGRGAPRRGRGDDAPSPAAAREENVVPLEVEQVRRLWDAAVHDGVRGGVEVLRAERLHDPRRSGRELGGLEHGGAARCDGAYEGAEVEDVREVPGPGAG